MDKFIKNIPESIRQGVFFGLNSGVITTTGLIAGISQTVKNPVYIIIAVVSLAISDGFSEAYGLYISKKAEKIQDDSHKPLYAFASLLLTKGLIVLSFLIPFIFSSKLKLPDYNFINDSTGKSSLDLPCNLFNSITVNNPLTSLPFFCIKSATHSTVPPVARRSSIIA